VGERVEAAIIPSRAFDVGAGRGDRLTATVEGGVTGVVIDCRGRPLHITGNAAERAGLLVRWGRSLDAYPPRA